MYSDQRIKALFATLCDVLAHTYAHWQATNIQIVNSGLDNLVCRADTVTFGRVAIRVPWQRWIANANDEQLDARTLLQQEAFIASYLKKHGIATPGVHALHIGEDDYDFLVSKFVDHDDSPPDAFMFGKLMKSIHTCPPPDSPLVLQTGITLNTMLAERLSRRLHLLEKFTGFHWDFPAYEDICTLLEWPDAQQSILHMDARPANILTQKGTIVAIVDWANALIGDPALELARIAESGLLDPDFLRGYNAQNDEQRHPPERVRLLYHLDTAVMLAIVFLSEAPDPQQAQLQIKRVNELCAAFKQAQL
jgi:aminoglycoside phosphotransferase (APT) family kinase protein